MAQRSGRTKALGRGMARKAGEAVKKRRSRTDSMMADIMGDLRSARGAKAPKKKAARKKRY